MEIPKEQECTKCHVVKPLTDEYFYPLKTYKYGLTRWCRLCRDSNTNEYNRLKRNTYRAAWTKESRGSHIHVYKAREFAREMKKYGTTTDWYRDKLVLQNGLCALCNHLSHHHGTLQRLQVDHNHVCCDIRTTSCGKCLRGLLCADCNILLSYLERFAEQAELSPLPGTWTEKALAYLRSYSQVKAAAV